MKLEVFPKFLPTHEIDMKDGLNPLLKTPGV